MQKNVIVIFGGSFNPPLNSHFGIAEQVLNQFPEVEKVVFTPVDATYPKGGLIENKHRYNMIKLVTDKNDKLDVSDVDMNEKSSLPTIETLKQMQEQYKDKEIWTLMGSDKLIDIDTWNDAEELVSKYKIIIMERTPFLMDKMIEESDFLRPHKANFKKLEQNIWNNYSSTYVREQIKKGKSVRYLVPDEVYEYIKQNKLYS